MQTWRVAARAGAQAFSHIRRDVLHPLGPDGARPYAEFTGEAVIGPFALVSRPAAEPRLSDDPEWPGRQRSRARVALSRGLPQRAVQVRERVLRADGAELGTGGTAGHRGQQLRLSTGRGGPSGRGAEPAARGVRAAAEGRSGLAGAHGTSLLLRPPRRRAAERPIARRAVGDERHLGHRPGVRRALPEPTQPAAARQPVRAGGERQRPVRARRRPGASAGAPRCRHSSASTTCSTRTPPARHATPTGGPSRSPASARSAARSGGAHSTPRRRAWPSARWIRSRTSPTPGSGPAATSTTWTSSP